MEKKRVHKVHHRINYEDRKYIQEHLEKEPVVKIAEAIGVGRQTVYKELKRGKNPDGIYDAEYAQMNLYRYK